MSGQKERSLSPAATYHAPRMGVIVLFVALISVVLAVLAILSFAAAQAELTVAKRQAAGVEASYGLTSSAELLIARASDALVEHESAGTTGTAPAVSPADAVALVSAALEDAARELPSSERMEFIRVPASAAEGASSADLAFFRVTLFGQHRLELAFELTLTVNQKLHLTAWSAAAKPAQADPQTLWDPTSGSAA